MYMARSTCGTNTPLVFNVTRRAPELLPPASPTPYEFKELSDIDNLESFRHHTPVIQFYQNNIDNSKHDERDPAKVIREATAKALVLYYPLAGRLRKKADGNNKLVVECNAQGIMFIEATADVCLKDFGEPLMPPFPCLDQLLFDVPGYSSVLNSPLILIQVTRLKCGGFIFAIRLNHTISDGQGLVQFTNAVAEFAHGAQSPSIHPVWDRHLLTTRNLPQPTTETLNFDMIAKTKVNPVPLDDFVHKSFFFGPTEIAALRRFIPPHQVKTSTFEILTACLWRCRTIALQPDPEEIVPLKYVVNARNRCTPLPSGYYGNAFTHAVALPTAAELTSKPVGHALQLIKAAKANIVRDYMTSLANHIALNGTLHLTTAWALVVSDVTHVGFDKVDFGWGFPAYGGPAKSGVGVIPGVVTFYVPYTNGKGETGVAIPVCLRSDQMEIFVKEMDKLLCHPIPSLRSSL